MRFRRRFRRGRRGLRRRSVRRRRRVLISRGGMRI